PLHGADLSRDLEDLGADEAPRELGEAPLFDPGEVPALGKVLSDGDARALGGHPFLSSCSGDAPAGTSVLEHSSVPRLARFRGGVLPLLPRSDFRRLLASAADPGKLLASAAGRPPLR